MMSNDEIVRELASIKVNLKRLIKERPDSVELKLALRHVDEAQTFLRDESHNEA